MTCKDCIHCEACERMISDTSKMFKVLLSEILKMNCDIKYDSTNILSGAEICQCFQDRSRFVELNIAKKIKHTPDIDKMREFHKLGLGKGMGERSIFWTCSNCKLWVSLAHKFCPNCGAKFEAEQAEKEREKNGHGNDDLGSY